MNWAMLRKKMFYYDSITLRGQQWVSHSMWGLLANHVWRLSDKEKDVMSISSPSPRTFMSLLTIGPWRKREERGRIVDVDGRRTLSLLIVLSWLEYYAGDIQEVEAPQSTPKFCLLPMLTNWAIHTASVELRSRLGIACWPAWRNALLGWIARLLLAQ